MPRKLFASSLLVLLSILNAASQAATMEETANLTATDLDFVEGGNAQRLPGCLYLNALGFWPLDGNSHDYLGTVEHQAPSCVTDRNNDGKVEESSCAYNETEKALQLGGKEGDPVVRIETDKFNFGASDRFTIMMRMNPKTLRGTQALVVKGNRAWDYGIWLNGGVLSTGSYKNNQRWSNGSYKIVKDMWHHIAYVYDDGTSRMYVNGRDVGVAKEYRINENGSGGGFLGFGARGEGLTHKFKGLMADVALLERAITLDEINEAAVGGFCTRPVITPGEDDLFAYYVAPVSNDQKGRINAGIFRWDSKPQISACYLTVDGRDKVSMKPSDGSFDSGQEDRLEYVFGYTNHPVEDVGIHEVCMWAVDTYGYESVNKECWMMPVYDKHEGYVVGSGVMPVQADDFIFLKHYEFLDSEGLVAFVIKYKETEGYEDLTYKGEFVYKTTQDVSFLFRSTKIYKYKRVNEKTGKAFFQGSGTVNGHPSPSGKNYRFKVWLKDSFGEPQDIYSDKLRLQIYWTEPLRGMRVYEFDNDLSYQKEYYQFRGEIRINPGDKEKEDK